MKLNMWERLKLLEILPNEGNRLNLKIMRKLRESLSFSEEELKKIPVQYEFMCVHQTLNKEGDITALCQNKGYFSGSPKCAEHDEPMMPTGQMNILNTPLLYTTIKDVHMGDEAHAICKSSLKMLEDLGKLQEAQASVYDKFFPAKEPE